MRLRTRLTILFLALLVVPIFVMSVVALDYAIAVTIDDLYQSAESLTRQTFDQMQLDLAKGASDPAAVLKQSASLHKLLDSAQAFGDGVVSASVIDPNGKVIVGAHGEGEGATAATLKPIAKLKFGASRWLPFAAIREFWTADVYELRYPVLANGRPLATISVGITTALIVDRLRHILLVVLAAGLIDTIVAWLLLSLITNRTFVQVSRIARGFEELAEGAEEVEIKLDGQEELSTLTNKFNELSRRVRTERSQLAAGGNRLFDIVRSIQDGVIMLDASGAVLFASTQALERLSLTGENVEGKPLKSVLGDKHELVNLAASAMETGAEARDVTIEPTAGSSVLVTLFKLGGGRTPAGLFIILRDLRSVVEIETALDYSNRLARLGALLSGVAHQLRGPLQGMSLRLELLRSDNGERKHRHIERLREEIDRLDSSVEALLRFLRPEDLTVGDFDLNQLLRELAARVGNDQIQIEFQLAEDLAEIHGDRGMISEALVNIITNAVEAMPRGGVLRLESRSDGDHAEAVVADTGTGVPQENLSKIFDLYFTTKSEGTGLGLSLALRAVELNQGSIKMDSRAGQGTTCHITLPLATRPTSSTEQADVSD